MLDTPQVLETAGQPAAVVHVTVPREQIREVMGPGLNEVLATLQAQGIAPAGPWFTHHHRMHPQVFDFEIGVPVSSPVQASGRVRPGELPAATVARTVYHGNYEGLPGAWGEFMGWIESNGLEPGEDLWEIYTVGPEAGAAPEEWRTELNRPVRRG